MKYGKWETKKQNELHNKDANFNQGDNAVKVFLYTIATFSLPGWWLYFPILALSLLSVLFSKLLTVSTFTNLKLLRINWSLLLPHMS